MAQILVLVGFFIRCACFCHSPVKMFRILTGNFHQLGLCLVHGVQAGNDPTSQIVFSRHFHGNSRAGVAANRSCTGLDTDITSGENNEIFRFNFRARRHTADHSAFSAQVGPFPGRVADNAGLCRHLARPGFHQRDSLRQCRCRYRRSHRSRRPSRH